MNLIELSFILYLGLSQRPLENKNVNIPSAALELYKSISEGNIITTNFPLPGLHTESANIARTYVNKGNHNIFIQIIT